MWYVCYFTQNAPWVCFLMKFVIYTSFAGLFLPLHFHYICIYIYMFLHNMVCALIFQCMLYNLIIGCNLYWVFSLYLSYLWVILPLHSHYIWFYNNLFVNILSIFTAISLPIQHDLLPSFTPSWGILFCIFPDLSCTFYHPR